MKNTTWAMKQEHHSTTKNKNNKNNNNKSSLIRNPTWKKPINLLGFLFLFTLTLLLFRLSPNSSTLSATDNLHEPSDRSRVSQAADEDPCLGHYIYIHDIPARFNDDVLKDCEALTRPKDKTSMCKNAENSGFGPPINGGVFTGEQSWFATNQFMLEMIFHERMKRYKCLTNDSSIASAVFVPFYAGLDLRRRLWRRNVAVRDSAGKDLVRWLRGRPEWKAMSGQDHFLVTGRISRDFRRNSSKSSDWGSNFMFLPESRNLSFLTIETSLSGDNEFGVPYPTYFHPSTTGEILRWQDRIRNTNRSVLFSFAGANRSKKNRNGSVRTEVIRQCESSNATCRFLDCDVKSNGCDDPISLMKLFESSVFCLQPPGDSLTRRSVFDSILAGCIPVFFNPGSAYEQYLWYLPKEYSKYSVYIPVKELRTGGRNKIEETLLGIPKERVIGMRENVVRLVPKIIYSKLNRYEPGRETLEDAFDIAVKGILERIVGTRRKQYTNEEAGVYN